MKLKVAVIGAGSMGKNHIRVYSSIKEVQLVAVAESDENRLKDISKKYNVKGYHDYLEMLDKEHLDLVSVVVPTKQHKEISINVINHKINVLLEKPIAFTISEAKSIIEKAKKKNVKLMIGHIERFNPAIIELKKRIESLGKIYKINIERIGPFPGRFIDTGVILDLSIHDIDIINYLIGKKVVSVYSKKQKLISFFYEDSLSAIIGYDSNIVATINANWITPIKKRSISIIGEKGMFEVDYLAQSLYFCKNRLDNENNIVKKIRVNKKEPLRQEILSFIKCVKKDIPSPVSGKDGLKALSIAKKL